MELDELKAALEKANAEAAAHRKGKAEERERAEALQKQLDEIANKAKSAEEEKLLAEKNYEELWKRKEGEYQSQAEKLRESASNWQKRYESVVIDGQIMSAAAKGNAHDAALVSKLIRDSIAVDEKGDVYVRAGDGVAMTEKGERLSVDAHVSAFLASNPYLVKPTGAGSGSQGGKGSTAQNVRSRAEFDAMPSGEQAAFMRNGGKLTD